MNKVKILLLILLNIVLQSTLFSRVNVFGAVPNLTLPFVVCLAMIFGSNTGGYAGLAIGLFEDIIFSNILGVRALIYFIIGYWIGANNFSFNRGDIKTGFIYVALSTVLYFVTSSVMYYFLGQKIDFVSYLAGPIFLEVIFNCALYYPTLKLFKKIFIIPSFRY